MSFQAYLDNIEKKTSKTPNDFIALANEKGFTSESKAGEIAAWLKTDFKLGHGHTMALEYVIKHGPKINSKHINSTGTHRDEDETLRLDGINNT